MALYKPGKVFWYEFMFNRERYRETTKSSNERAARQIEAVERVRLAKGESGIKDRGPAPPLFEFRAATRDRDRDGLRGQTCHGEQKPPDTELRVCRPL